MANTSRWEVRLQPGTYRLNTTMVLGPDHSGTSITAPDGGVTLTGCVFPLSSVRCIAHCHNMNVFHKPDCNCHRHLEVLIATQSATHTHTHTHTHTDRAFSRLCGNPSRLRVESPRMPRRSRPGYESTLCGLMACVPHVLVSPMPTPRLTSFRWDGSLGNQSPSPPSSMVR